MAQWFQVLFSIMLRVIVLSLFGIVGLFGRLMAQQDEYSSFIWLLLEGKDSLVDQVLKQDKYRLQFICTEIDREREEPLHTERHVSGKYFYPASTVKLPVAILTIEKINRLGLNLDDRLVLNPDVQCGNTAYIDDTRPDGIPFRQLLEEMLVMSNNEYYSVLFHFLSPGEINQRLNELGYSGVHILRAFNGCEMEGHLKTNSWQVIRDGVVVATQKAVLKPLNWMSEMYVYDHEKLIGKQHEYRGEIRPGPFDFNYHLELPLEQLHEMTLRLTRPEFIHDKGRWQISSEQRTQLIKWMSMYPCECCDDAYRNLRKYPNTYNKYFLIGEDEEELRTISKIGLSYGFVTEVAYINISENRGLLFTASLYVNENDIVNDGKYEYEEIAKPFLARVGSILYSHYSK